MSVVRSIGVLLLGAAAMAVGAYLVVAHGWVVGFGWTAYAPLSNTSFTPNPASPMLYLGLLIFALGAAVVGGWVGYRVRGRRRAAV